MSDRDRFGTTIAIAHVRNEEFRDCFGRLDFGRNATRMVTKSKSAELFLFSLGRMPVMI